MWNFSYFCLPGAHAKEIGSELALFFDIYINSDVFMQVTRSNRKTTQLYLFLFFLSEGYVLADVHSYIQWNGIFDQVTILLSQ